MTLPAAASICPARSSSSYRPGVRPGCAEPDPLAQVARTHTHPLSSIFACVRIASHRPSARAVDTRRYRRRDLGQAVAGRNNPLRVLGASARPRSPPDRRDVFGTEPQPFGVVGVVRSAEAEHRGLAAFRRQVGVLGQGGFVTLRTSPVSVSRPSPTGGRPPRPLLASGLEPAGERPIACLVGPRDLGLTRRSPASQATRPARAARRSRHAASLVSRQGQNDPDGRPRRRVDPP